VEGLGPIAAAAAAFVGTHFLLSHPEAARLPGRVVLLHAGNPLSPVRFSIGMR
jgi:hypothetical protein